MPEAITKLQPDRTLELGFFNHPASNAALHSTTTTGWKLSGKFRMQHDHAIIEWNKYNRWDHPRLRYLPDGDLSGITLTYDEQRTNCQPMESAAFPYTDWPDLLVWATPPGGNEVLYRVPLRNYASVVSGSLIAAQASLTIGGAIAENDVISLTIMSEKYSYTVQAADTLALVAQGLAAAVNTGPESRLCDATASGTTVTLIARSPGRDGNAIAMQVTLYHLATKAKGRLTYSGAVQYSPASTATSSVDGAPYSAAAVSPDALDDLVGRLAQNMQGDPKVDAASAAGGIINLTAKNAGEGGNSIALTAGGSNGISGAVTTPMSGGAGDGAPTVITVTPMQAALSDGSSAVTWRVTLPFGALLDNLGNAVPSTNIRRLRWTYSPPLRAPEVFNGSAEFVPLDFEVIVTNWSAAGTGTAAKVAGPLSHRIEGEDPGGGVTFSGAGWAVQQGNVSAENMSYTSTGGNYVEIAYTHPAAHDLYLGTQRTFDSAIVQVQIDGGAPFQLDLYTPGQFPGDIFLAREKLDGNITAGAHTVRITHTGTKNAGSTGFFFYFDFIEAAVPADVPDAPEIRTDVGLATDYDTAALWLSPERLAWSLDKLGLKGELNHFVGIEFFYEKVAVGWSNATGTVTISGTVTPGDRCNIVIGGSTVSHDVAYGDTLASIASGLAMAINSQTSVWADSSGPTVTVHARVPGTAANVITLTANSNGTEVLTTSGSSLSGGANGSWEVDGASAPILNLAARDWHRAMASALAARGMAATMAFSMELKHAPLAWGQKFNNGATVITGNGSVQTSPSVAAVRTFWKECYKALAAEMSVAGVTPRLQFGETQWWYFASGTPASMAYYDTSTTADFQAQEGRPLHVFTAPNNDPSINGFVDANFLRDRIASFCDEVRSYVLASYSGTLFEVLWPRDVNDPDFNALNYYVNLPAASWAPANIARFKTEAFQESFPQRNMNKARVTIRFPFTTLAFSRDNSRHLLGTMAGFPWDRQIQIADSERVGLTTIWAWDQFCAIGRKVPLPRSPRAAHFAGA